MYLYRLIRRDIKLKKIEKRAEKIEKRAEKKWYKKKAMGGVDICAIASRIDLTFNNLTSVNFVYTYISIRYISNQYSLISYSFSKIVFCPKNRRIWILGMDMLQTWNAPGKSWQKVYVVCTGIDWINDE